MTKTTLPSIILPLRIGLVGLWVAAVIMSMILLAGCGNPAGEVTVEVNEDSVTVREPGGLSFTAPLENIVVHGYENIPTPTPVPAAQPTDTPSPTPNATPTPMATLPPIRPDFASIIEARNLEYERRVRQEIDELRESMPYLAWKIEGLPWIEDGIAGLREVGAVSC